MTGILIAGVGNIFQGDDGFGVEVAQRLVDRRLGPGVEVTDFGIRGIDLTYALMDAYDAVVLVDAAARGERPGTLSLIEPDAPEFELIGAGRRADFGARSGSRKGAADRGGAGRELPPRAAAGLRAARLRRRGRTYRIERAGCGRNSTGARNDRNLD